MGQKGNLAVFEGSSISETGEAMPTKIGVHACYINAYLHEFLGRFQSIRFFTGMDYKLILSPKPEKPRPTKLVCMHLTSIPTCINFLGQFQSIRFFTGMDYKLILSPKPEKSCPPKLVCMHVTSIPTCIKFLGRFRLIEFF